MFRSLTFFASTAPLLNRYFTEVAQAQGETREAELWMEAEERLEQLDFLIQQITQLQKTASQHMRRSTEAHDQNVARNVQDETRFFSSPEMAESRHFLDLHKEVIFQIKLFAEAFYYFAARLRSILRHFPHLKRLEAPGVRNVRNHLI